MLAGRFRQPAKHGNEKLSGAGSSLQDGRGAPRPHPQAALIRDPLPSATHGTAPRRAGRIGPVGRIGPAGRTGAVKRLKLCLCKSHESETSCSRVRVVGTLRQCAAGRTSARALPWTGVVPFRSPVGARLGHSRQCRGACRLPIPSALPTPCSCIFSV